MWECSTTEDPLGGDMDYFIFQWENMEPTAHNTLS